MTDANYTNGVIAVKEKCLLGEKLLRFTEMTAQEVLRALTESGFGGDGQDTESICNAEERALDDFIREYAPSKAAVKYLLAPYDFHNAKALCKAEILHTDAEEMLSPEGLIPIEKLTAAIKDRAYGLLSGEIAKAVKTALETENISGAEVGVLFDDAMHSYLLSELKWNPLLKKMLVRKIDQENILTVFRSKTPEQAEALFVQGGKLSTEELCKLFEQDMGTNPFKGTAYEEFYALCLRARDRGLPFAEAERYQESFEAEYFRARKYELEGKEPFLYFVFRRRAEIQNVRIILVCLNAGLSAHEIKKRLRAI